MGKSNATTDGQGCLDGQRAVLNALNWVETVGYQWNFQDMKTFETQPEKCSIVAPNTLKTEIKRIGQVQME